MQFKLLIDFVKFDFSVGANKIVQTFKCMDDCKSDNNCPISISLILNLYQFGCILQKKHNKYLIIVISIRCTF